MVVILGNLDEDTLRELKDVLRRRVPLAVSFGSDHSDDGRAVFNYLRGYEYSVKEPLPVVARGQIPTITLPSGRLIQGTPSDMGKAFTAAKAIK